MSDAEPCGGFVRHVTMALDGDEVVRGLDSGLGEVSIQLVKRLTADAAVAAVLEEEYGPLTRLGNSRVERSNIGKGLQFHRDNYIVNARTGPCHRDPGRLRRSLVRTGMEAGRLERTAHVRECLGCRGGELQIRTAQQSVYVIAAEADPFHMKGRYSPSERFAFVDQRPTHVALGLLPDDGNEILDPGFGRFSIIRGRHSTTL